jgi:signal transduction histidine kinase
MAVPVLAGDGVVAVLEFFVFQPREQDRRLIELVAGLAAQLGPTILRRRTEDALRASQERLTEALRLAEQRGIELEDTAADLAQANLGLETYTREMEVYAGVQRDFVASASHELRTPLTSILGYLEMLAEEAERLSPSGLQFFEVVCRNARRLQALVEDLLTMTQVESGTLATTVAPFDLNGLLDATGEAFRPVCERSGLELEVVPAAGLPAVLADRTRTEQVLDNLVSNAVKFTAPGGRVRIGSVAAGRRVAVEVADTGVGISEDDLPRVFERFYRCESSTRMAVPGTGLGLAIAKAMAEAQGGALTVRSRLGEGATFTLLLPAADGGRPAGG